jgi:hypothetical protein
MAKIERLLPLTRFAQTLPIVLLVFAVTTAPATTYYVSTTGNDSQAGTQSQPWHTVQQAAQHVLAGDTVVVAPGTYPGYVTVTASGQPGSPITFTGTGTVEAFIVKGSFITISSLNIGTTHSSGIAVDLEGNNCTVSGCAVNMYHSGLAGVTNWAGFRVNGSGCSLLNCDITGVPGGWASVVIGGDNNLVQGCKIHDEVDEDAFNGWGKRNIIRGNEVVHLTNPHAMTPGYAHADFFQTWGFAGSSCLNYVIENNYVHDCDIQIGNTSHDGNDATMHDLTIRNNVFANVTSSFFSGLHNTFIYNNLFYKTGTYQNCPVIMYGVTAYASYGSQLINNALYMCGSDSSNTQQGAFGSSGFDLNSIVVDHNYYAGSGNAAKNGAAGYAFLGTHAVNGGNPSFMNPTGSSPDYRPRPGSVLINAGVTLASLKVDKNGLRRPQGKAWCIGPYEYGSQRLRK